MNAPFGILRTHGVERTHIAVLEQRFGAFPKTVKGPDDAILWALSWLPWPQLAPMLRGWVERAFKKGDVLDDRRAVRLLALITAVPDEEATARIATEVGELLETLARVRGYTADPDIQDEKIGDDFRAWASALAGIAAAHSVVCRERKHATLNYALVSAADNTLDWMLAQVPAATRELARDRIIQELMGAVAVFVGSWVDGGEA